MIPGEEILECFESFVHQTMPQEKYDFFAVFYIGHGFGSGPGFWRAEDNNVRKAFKGAT
jgi:hypothetical protein